MNRQAGGRIPVFLFTDIEGSTSLWEKQPARMSRAIERHDALARGIVQGRDGRIVKTTGDGIYAVFEDALDAVLAVIALQTALADPALTAIIPLRIRCGLHCGPAEERDGDYFGRAVNRTARIMGAAHGGQVLLSKALVERLDGRLPGDASLLDLGTVRLRDLTDPEDVYQLVHPGLATRFPPLRSLEATPNNLPQQITAFIGRQHDVSALSQLLASHRMLTLVGTGGIGKSRLAVQVAAECLDAYPDGAWFIDLAPLGNSSLVPNAVAHALGVPEQGEATLIQALCEHLRSRRLLIVLDNCEHLVAACAALVATLLRSAPALRVIATSREPLDIEGEQRYGVNPLSLPDDSAVTVDADAVALFLDRLRLQRPEVPLADSELPAVIEICRQLDGIPLAIELAAARAESLTIDRIRAGLTDRFRMLVGGRRTAMQRQKTLRATIDWSHDRLAPQQQGLLHSLSVFSGGWTLEAAEEICAGDALPKDAIVDALARLVQTSLVVFDGVNGRYRFLETIRQYAAERLRQQGRAAALLARHREYFAELAEHAEGPLVAGGEQQTRWLERLSQEHDNLRSVLDASLESDASPRLATRICGSIYRFWMYRGHIREGRGRCVDAVKRTQQSDPALAKTLLGAGSLAYRLGDLQSAHESCTQALTASQSSSDKSLEARILNNLAIIAGDREQLDVANDFLTRAAAAASEAGQLPLAAIALANQARMLVNRGDFEGARVAADRARTLCEAIGDRTTEFHVLAYRIEVAIHQADLDLAARLADEALAISAKLGNAVFASEARRLAGRIALLRGDLSGSGQLIGRALRESEDAGVRFGVAEALDELTLLAAARGDFLAGAQFRGAADRVRSDIATPRFPIDRARYDRAADACRTGLGAVRFDALYGAANASATEDQVARALDWTTSNAGASPNRRAMDGGDLVGAK